MSHEVQSRHQLLVLDVHVGSILKFKWLYWDVIIVLHISKYFRDHHCYSSCKFYAVSIYIQVSFLSGSVRLKHSHHEARHILVECQTPSQDQGNPVQ